jgi:hypothetical protein
MRRSSAISALRSIIALDLGGTARPDDASVVHQIWIIWRCALAFISHFLVAPISE